MAALRIEAIRLLSAAPEKLATFLCEALDFEAIGGGRLRLGNEIVEVRQADGAPYPADLPSNDTRFQHFAVIVSDIVAAYARLRAVEDWMPISTDGPEKLPKASGGVSAFKFRSPESHPLELLQFPAGKAPAPWDSRPGLHLGIDHSAIGVSDTQASVAFYETLGFMVANHQTNRGEAQGRLDGLGGNPTVEVAALNPPGGAPPHLELLCYQKPAAIRSAPARSADTAATRLVLSPLAGDTQDPDGHRLVAAEG